jgi:aryl-alcohol dehydrogenase-like predicted oxidoreductase
MNTNTFGKTQLQVSPLGFGGAPIGYLATDQERTSRLLNLLLDAGVNLIDTAASYEGSEEMISRAIIHRREQFVLVSKCGTQVPGVDGKPWSAALIAQTVERSLQRLKTDALDVMLLHSCDLDTLKTGEAIGALVKARKEGKIRFVGYSGDNEAVAYAAGLPEIAVIETSINLADQANIDGVLPVARQHNVGVLAKRPIANAAWKSAAQQPGMYAGYARTYTERFAKMGLSAADLGFAGDPAKAWPEIALRFTLSQLGVHTAIIGTTSPENATANIAAAAKGPLDEPTIQKIRQAFARAQGNEKWMGQT